MYISIFVTFFTCLFLLCGCQVHLKSERTETEENSVVEKDFFMGPKIRK